MFNIKNILLPTIVILVGLYFIYIFINVQYDNSYINKLKNMNIFLQKKYLNNKENIENIENIENFTNLIGNGDFKNGLNINNNINKNGYNKIIIMKNPTKSSYVLQQKNTGSLTFYEIMIPAEINSKYYFTFWVSIEPNINNIDYTKLVYVRISKTDSDTGTNTTNVPQLEIKIVNKMAIDNNTWYQIQTTFYTNNESVQNIFIYLNYSKTLQGTNVYFTKLSLYRLLPTAENFIYNESLNLYLNGCISSSKGNNYIWSDLSGSGNDFYFLQNPVYNEQICAYSVNNNLINGPSTMKLLNSTSNSFTFIIIFNNNNSFSNTIIDEESEHTVNIIEFYGNNNVSISININQSNNYLICKLPNKNVLSNKSLTFINKTLLAITYNNGIINIYQDNVLILNTATDNLYFNSNNICINKNKLWNANIYALLNYTRVVPNNELTDIRDYFMNNMNKDSKNNTNINNIIFDDNINNNFEIINIQAYNENNQNQEFITDNLNDSSTDNSNDISNMNMNMNVNVNMKKDTNSCKTDCKELCKKFIQIDSNNFNLQDYNTCRDNCKFVLPSCQKYCLDNNNLRDEICTTIDKESQCPVAYKKDNNYYIYINPQSDYAKKYKFSGIRNYGPDREKAKKKYEINFPKCDLPSAFKEGNGIVNLEYCPYNIYEGNPCLSSACIGVNWNTDNYKNLNMTENCKKEVSHYCQMNKGVDEKCECWLPENFDKKECIEFRKHFENPTDYCKISQYDIEEHPDINKYVRKDNIPCYGCVLDMPKQ